MAMFAELEDGRRLEFPDGTDPAVIQRTVKNVLGMAASQTPLVPAGPTEGMGEAALIAAGRGTDKLVQGVKQGYHWLRGNQGELDKMAAAEAEKDAAYKPLQEKHPHVTALGEIAPHLAAGFATGGTSLVGAAAAAALPSALSYGTGEERLKRAAVDALAGGAGNLAGRAIGRLLKPAGQGTSSPITLEAAEAAERIGFKPTPGQVTGNLAQRNFENFLMRTPGGSGVMQRAGQANQDALNRAGARAMGEASEKLDAGTFSTAKGRITGELDRIWNNNNLQMDPGFIGGLQHQLARAQSLNPEQAAAVNAQVQKLLQKVDPQTGEIPGSFVNNWQSELRLVMEGEKGLHKDILNGIRKTVIGTFNRSVGPADAKALTKARGEYGAFKTLTEGLTAEAGDVSAARVASSLRRQNPGAFRTGQTQGELADIARVGEAFKGVQNPNSGQLAQYGELMNPLAWPVIGVNNMAARAYMSPLGQRYFTRGLLDVGQTGQELLGQAGAGLALPLGRGLLGVE